MDFILTAWKGQNERAKKKLRVLDTLFLALSGVYLIYMFTATTTLYPPYPLRLERKMFAAMVLVAVLRLALIGPRRKEVWLCAGLALVYTAARHDEDYNFLWFLAVLSAGYIGMDYRRILKTWLITVGGALAVTVFAALSGGITNIVYYRDGLRSSWGISYPTDLASIGLFLLVILWVAWRRLPDWAALLLGAASLTLSAVVTMSRNGMICSALFCAAIGYHWLEERFIVGRRRRDWISKGVYGFLTVAFPLFAAVMFLMVYLYARGLPVGLRLNELLSERLEQCLAGLRLHGLRPFGSAFAQKGNGFSVFPRLDLNFIDSSYVLIPMRYGWVLLLALCALWGWTIRRAVKCGDRRLALAMGLIAFHSILEHHFSEVNYNILLVMPFAAYAALPAKAHRAPGKPRWAAGLATLALSLAAAWLFGPWLLTRLRTLLQARGYVGGGINLVPMLAILLVVAAWTVATIWLVYRLVQALASRDGKWLRALAPLLLCLGVAGGLSAWSSQAVDRAAAENAALVEADSAALEVILAVAESPVYADELPDVYQRRFEGIRDSALPLEDLARNPGCTVLTTVDEERNVFFHRGFRYARISERHAVYTGDPAVIQALEAAGWATADYYDTVHSVDLENTAELNGLDYSGTGLLLDGPGHSLRKGEKWDLFEGEYEAVYALRLSPGGFAPGDAPVEVCRLRVNAYEGEMPLGEIPIYSDQFDSEGKLTATVSFSVGYAQGTVFLAEAGEGRRVYVEDIRFGKVRRL